MRLTFTIAVVLLSGGSSCAGGVKMVGVTPEEANEGFVSLFDGKTLNGWNGDVTHYAVEDGAMVCHGANVYTEKEYANFILRFEFKLPPGGNNGVGIRTPNHGVAGYEGMEIQILDDGHEQYRGRLQPYQTHGSIYGVVPAKRGFLRPAGQWNQEEIVADGSHIVVTLNGKVITDADLNKIERTPDHHAHPGLHNPRGYIGCIGHDKDPVAFRNVRIKQLP